MVIFTEVEHDNSCGFLREILTYACLSFKIPYEFMVYLRKNHAMWPIWGEFWKASTNAST